MKIGLPIFPVTHLASTWGDKIVFTTFDEGQFALNSPISGERIFYLWDLDWHCNGYDYNTILETLNKPDRLYCRAESHQKAIFDFCGRKAEIMPSFNIKELYYGKHDSR